MSEWHQPALLPLGDTVTLEAYRRGERPATRRDP
jgi:hypothetical protein